MTGKYVGAPEHNGNQDTVLQAISGHAGITKIGLGRVTGLDENAIDNAVRRLLDIGQIRRMTFGGYALVNKRCLLSELWR